MRANRNLRENERFVLEELGRLDQVQQRRFLRHLEYSGIHSASFNGRNIINFASNDYLGLAEEERVREAAKLAVDRYSSSASSSRLISGNYALLEELEEALAAFKGKEAALVFSSGYLANLGLISGVAEAEDQIFSDSLNHASIIDGCRLSKAATYVFRHRDLDHLETILLNVPRARRRLIVTDAVFSMDGDVADLPGLAYLAERYECLLMVDEAHSTGVLGSGGRGIRQHYIDLGLLSEGRDCIDLDMGTLSKALAAQGGFVACSAQMREFFVNKSRSFIFDTALAPPAAGAALKALQIIAAEPFRQQRLIENQVLMSRELEARGLGQSTPRTAIFPVILGEGLTTMRVCENLLIRGFYAQGIRPPAVPEGGARLRITVSAAHHQDEIVAFGGALEEALRESGIMKTAGTTNE